jgi:predicted nucleic acid-binding protein
VRIYCDTCIYRDVFEGRKGRWIDFGEVALNVFRQVKSKEYTLVISDWVIDEFKKYKDEKILLDFIEKFEKDSVILIERTKQDEEEARKLSKDNYPDALHVILAKKEGAICLVTRDVDYLMEFRDLIEITRPELL